MQLRLECMWSILRSTVDGRRSTVDFPSVKNSLCVHWSKAGNLLTISRQRSLVECGELTYDKSADFKLSHNQCKLTVTTFRNHTKLSQFNEIHF